MPAHGPVSWNPARSLHLLRTHRRLTVMLAALVAIGSVTLVLAETGTITACVRNSNGEIRIVTQASDCKSNEQPLAWNLQGPVGPQGPPGPEGPAGSVEFESRKGSFDPFLLIFSTPMTLASIDLPEGDHLVFARVKTQNFDGTNCSLAVDDSDGPSSGLFQGGLRSGALRNQFGDEFISSFQALVTVGADGHADLICFNTRLLDYRLYSQPLP